MSPHHPHRYVIEVWSNKAAEDGAWIRAAVITHGRLALAALAAGTREFGYARLRLRCLHYQAT